MGLFGWKNKSSLPETTTAEASRIKNILGMRDLESMPAQAARAFQLASDPRSSSSDFVKVIEKDEALSSRVVRIANSVYFYRGTQATDIEKAVANIGLNELRCLLSASMLRSLLQGKIEVRAQIWANSVSVAIGCKILCRYTDTTSEGEAFLAGLVHDLGKLIMVRRNYKLYERTIMFAGSGDLTFIEAEEKTFETNHIDVGKWAAEQWNFPTSIVKAITHHHNTWPTDANRKGRGTSLPILIKCADIIAHSLGIGHPRHMKKFQNIAISQLPEVWTQLDIDNEAASAILGEFERQFKQEANLYDSEDT